MIIILAESPPPNADLERVKKGRLSSSVLSRVDVVVVVVASFLGGGTVVVVRTDCRLDWSGSSRSGTHDERMLLRGDDGDDDRVVTVGNDSTGRTVSCCTTSITTPTWDNNRRIIIIIILVSYLVGDDVHHDESSIYILYTLSKMFYIDLRSVGRSQFAMWNFTSTT